MVSIFEEPGLFFGVWGVCVLTHVVSFYGVNFPSWWLFITLLGAITPILGLIIGGLSLIE